MDRATAFAQQLPSPWHVLAASEVAARLGTDLSAGLAPDEARRRLQKVGPNELGVIERVSAWSVLLNQFKNVLLFILLVAIGLSLLLGHLLEAIAIAVIVLFAVLLGFIQEYRAERAIEALRDMAAPVAEVIRGGKHAEVPARDLVPGDVIALRAGNRVPADGRVIEAINLRTEEAALTGESQPVEKQAEALADPDLPVGDRCNMIHAGTVVAYGRGRAVVTATGLDTEFGRIAQLLKTVEEERTPLQHNLDRVGQKLAIAAAAVVALVVVLGVLRGQPWIEMLIFGIALAVAVVPEALPAVVTISLALGVRRMVRRNALIRKLPAVETLGCTSVICSDKTGTLTKDEMTVRKIVVAGRQFDLSGSGFEPRGELTENGARVGADPALQLLLRAAILASDARLVHDEATGVWSVKGDPTEGALVVAAAKIGLDKARIDAEMPRVSEIPFTSEARRMTTLHRGPDGDLLCSKGAPEVILEACQAQLVAGGPVPLTDEARAEVLAHARELASQALRVLGVACKAGATLEHASGGMTLVGLVGMMDPPRPEVKPAIELCRLAGIRPVMITGDHPLTAAAIAREIGILQEGRVITGQQLSALSDEDFEREVEQVEAYARVSPADKLRIVTALQKHGACVAMTGDGVNDAPALKKADIGIAMGITGTDVSKEAAAMTLTDDNFASIVAAVEEGRAVFDNIKKYLMYLLSSNVGEIALMAGATLAGLPLPLTAVQILYVNLATDGLPALALAVDPPAADLMRRPPRDPKLGVFTRPAVALMLAGGAWSALVNISLFSWALTSGRELEHAMTMTFVSLVLIQFFKAYNYRSDRVSVLHRPFANCWLNLAILWELLLLSLIVYLPFLHQVFGTFSLTVADWAVIMALSFSVSPVLELTKWMARRGWFGPLDDTGE